MAWTIRTLKESSKEVVLQINSAKADDSTSLDIPWTYVDSLLAAKDGGRTPTKDDIYISNIMGHSGYHDVFDPRGNRTVNFDIDVTCPTDGIGEAENEDSLLFVLNRSKNIKARHGNGASRKRINGGLPCRISLDRDNLGYSSSASKSTQTHNTSNMLSLNVSSGSIVSGSSTGLSYIINFRCRV